MNSFVEGIRAATLRVLGSIGIAHDTNDGIAAGDISLDPRQRVVPHRSPGPGHPEQLGCGR